MARSFCDPKGGWYGCLFLELQSPNFTLGSFFELALDALLLVFVATLTSAREHPSAINAPSNERHETFPYRNKFPRFGHSTE
jgi:hypothetical protein